MALIWSYAVCRRLGDLRSSNDNFPEVKASFLHSHLKLFAVLSCFSKELAPVMCIGSALIVHSSYCFHETTAVSPAEM